MAFSVAAAVEVTAVLLLLESSDTARSETSCAAVQWPLPLPGTVSPESSSPAVFRQTTDMASYDLATARPEPVEESRMNGMGWCYDPDRLGGQTVFEQDQVIAPRIASRRRDQADGIVRAAVDRIREFLSGRDGTGARYAARVRVPIPGHLLDRGVDHWKLLLAGIYDVGAATERDSVRDNDIVLAGRRNGGVEERTEKRASFKTCDLGSGGKV